MLSNILITVASDASETLCTCVRHGLPVQYGDGARLDPYTLVVKAQPRREGRRGQRDDSSKRQKPRTRPRSHAQLEARTQAPAPVLFHLPASSVAWFCSQEEMRT